MEGGSLLCRQPEAGGGRARDFNLDNLASATPQIALDLTPREFPLHLRQPDSPLLALIQSQTP